MLRRPDAPFPEPEATTVRYRLWIAPADSLVEYLLVPRDLTIEAVVEREKSLTLQKRTMRLIGVSLGAMLILVLVAACSLSGSKDSTATVAASPTSSATPIPLKLGTPIPIGKAPSPGAVDPAKFVMIEQWQELQVPQYPGATVGQFMQLGATTVKNGGSLTLTTTDSVEQVIAYYRAAMPFLGWKEIASNAQKASFTSKTASITISASSANGATAILMILGDV